MGIIWNLYFLTDDEEEVKESIDEYEKDERLRIFDIIFTICSPSGRLLEFSIPIINVG